MPDRWRADAPALAWRQWDDELVLYNDVSGSTHQLGAFGAEVLLCLLQRDGDAHIDDLVADMAERVELTDASELAREVERVLDGLAALQLAVRVRA